MAIIPSGTKVYLNTDVAKPLISGGEPTNQNDKLTGFENVQDYYGDLEQPQKDVLFQPASLLGTTTDKKQVKDGVLFYNVLIKGVVDRRTSHGWAAGTYEKVDWLAWVSSADITDSEEVALEKYNKRSDAASLEAIKNANSNNQTTVVPVVKKDAGTSKNQTVEPPTKKGVFASLSGGNTPLIIGGIVVGISLIGLALYVSAKNKKEALLAMQYQQVRA